MTALLALVDAIRVILAAIEATGTEPDAEHGALIATLEALARGDSSPNPLAPSAPAAPPVVVPPLAPLAAPPTPPTASSVAPATTAKRLDEGPHADHAGDAAYEPLGAPDAEGRLALADQSVRIDVTVLDRLMDVVGELVLARNQIVRFAGAHEDGDLLKASQRLDLITTELQEGVMKTRLQPIGNVVTKFPRLVRDLAHALGKEVRLEMSGVETELDRTILEAIRDPLTHLVRNAVDHGLETPSERLAVGKPREGVVSFRAFHEGGQVNLEIADDGRGIVAEKVRERAIQRGLLSRLDAVRRAHGLETLGDVVAALRQGRDATLSQAVLDALTTNETSFFRDLQPFELFRTELLPSLLERRPFGPVRVWCAACSFGQEPYSLALVLREHFDESTWRRVEILATDLSATALARAEAGEFSQLEVNRGLPSSLLLRYFKATGRSFRLDDSVRRMVTFRSLNLVAAWPQLPPLDIVFLRNVLIYFDAPTKRRVLAKVREVLSPEGCLVLGSTETLLDETARFERFERGRTVYHRPIRREVP